MPLRCLFVDFNSFFASVEQHDAPELRGRPVGVVPVVADTTCCIAASYEAKQFGISTGTLVADAKAACPDIALVQARPARYVEVHHALMAAIEDCVPHGAAESIDEVPCYLIGRERDRANAEAIAAAIKRTLRERGFGTITCSIGIAPNRFLAKTASDMRKPDGLTVIEQHELPHALFGLELRDFCGIGPSMEHRLKQAGIATSEQLCRAGRQQLRAAWGSLEGERFWLLLRGHDVPERRTQRGSVGHSHVLGPELRSFEGARAVLFKLLAKAAMRMRKEQHVAGGLSIRVRLLGLEERFERDVAFAPLSDTPALLSLLGRELDGLDEARRTRRWRPSRHPPLSVAVTLTQLEPMEHITGELLASRAKAKALSGVLDRVNQRYGNNSLYFGSMSQALQANAAPMRIPFGTIPTPRLEEDVARRASRDLDAGLRPDGALHELWLQRERQFKVMAHAGHASRCADPARADAVANDAASAHGCGGMGAPQGGRGFGNGSVVLSRAVTCGC